MIEESAPTNLTEIVESREDNLASENLSRTNDDPKCIFAYITARWAFGSIIVLALVRHVVVDNGFVGEKDTQSQFSKLGKR